jgi:DNA polymerase-3 subunit epsilon
VLSLGKFAGRRLRDVARTDPGYLDWMLGAGFADEMKALVGDALRGRCSAPPGLRQP